MKRFSLFVIILVLMTASLSAAMGKAAPRDRQTIEIIVPVGAYSRINVAGDNGNVIVNGVRGAREIRVIAMKSVWGRTPGKARAANEGLEIKGIPSGDLLRIQPTHEEDWNHPYEVEYYITVPTSFRVEVTTEKGAVQVRGAHDAGITTQVGDIILSNVNIVTAESAKGAVEVDSTAGPVAVTSGKGNVRVRLSGGIKATHIETQSGNVSLRLPTGSNADIAMSTSKGTVSTEGLTLRETRQSRYGLRGTLGEGGTPVEVVTQSGAVLVTTRSLGPITPEMFLRPTATSVR